MLEDRLKDAKGILHPDLTAKLKQKFKYMLQLLIALFLDTLRTNRNPVT